MATGAHVQSTATAAKADGRKTGNAVSAYKIERGIPLPNQYGSGHNGSSEAIRKLKPTESVLLPNTTIQSANGLCRQVRKNPQYAARTFTCRTVKGEGVRVWRVE